MRLYTFKENMVSIIVGFILGAFVYIALNFL